MQSSSSSSLSSPLLEHRDEPILEANRSFNTKSVVVLSMVANITSHLLFGLEPVLPRYLERTSNIPALSLTAMCNIVAFICCIPLLAYTTFKHLRKEETMGKESSHYVNIEENRSIFQRFLKIMTWIISLPLALWRIIVENRLLLIFSLLVTLRIVSTLFAPEFTNADNIQLITLTTPFIVALVGFILLKESVSMAVIICMTIVILGGALTILGGFSVENSQSSYHFYWTINFREIAKNFKPNDTIGLFLAACAAVFSAVAIVVNRSSANLRHPAAVTPDIGAIAGSRNLRIKKLLGHKSFSPISLFIAQTVTMIVITLPLSLVINDWSVWYDMKWSDWAVFFTLTIAVFLCAALMLISTVQVLGAANASCMLGLRLISTIVVSGFLLHEWLNNFWQIVGSLLVLIALTIFLFHQRHLHKKKKDAIEGYRAWHTRRQQNEATATA